MSFLRQDSLCRRVSEALTYFVVAFVVVALSVSKASAQRALGLDISAWQGNISQATWNNIRNVENRQFVFLRSSRGGTTGYYNQNDAANNNGLNTLSQRYDDPYYIQNINRATTAGIYAGSYHFSRPDVVESTLNSGGIANTGTDEANHFMQMAGPWMRPGYLLPVHDLEAGESQRTDNQLAQFTLDFSNRIYEVMGIRPAIYINGNYAQNVIGGASAALRTEVVNTHPTLWIARWPNQTNPSAIPVQTANPNDSLSWLYGPWDDPPHPAQPWKFWQYTSTGRLQSFNSGGSNLDMNVANGGVEFLKDNLVPALWWSDSSGDWSTLANWNSGQTPVAPVQGPGQVARVGTLTLPTPRLPGAAGSGVTSGQHDTVILDRANVDVTVTLTTGTHNIRKLYMREALDITGGLLNINYVPSADSTPISAQFSGPVSLAGAGSLSVHTLQVDAEQQFSVGGEGALTFNKIDLRSHATAPAKLLLTADANFVPHFGAAAVIQSTGAGASGVIDLGGAQRKLNVSDGAAPTDISLNVPVVNGGLTKTGAGTLALAAANTYGGDTIIEAGKLSLATASLANTADVYLAPGALLELNTGGATNVIDSLFIDGMSMQAGVWGTVGSGAQFTSELLAGSGFLEVTTFVAPPLWGDYNEDGVVDAGDYVVWRDAMGGETSLPNDDTPGVGEDDFERWKTNFGRTSLSGGAASSAVPEPSVAMLAVAAALLVEIRTRLRSVRRDE